MSRRHGDAIKLLHVISLVETAIVAAVAFNNATVSALIGGCFLLLNTVLTVQLTRYYRDRDRPDTKEKIDRQSGDGTRSNHPDP